MTFEEWYKERGFKYDPEAHEWIAKAAWEAATEAMREACAQECSAIALGDSKTEAEEIAAYKCEAAIRAL